MRFLSPQKAAQEKRDLGLLLLLAVLIPGVWAVLLGWDPAHAAAGHDSLSQIFPFFADLRRAGGDWRALLYRPELLGGVVVHNVFGSLPIYRLLAWMGLDSVTCLSLSVFFFQGLFAFLAARAALDLGAYWSPQREAARPSLTALAAVALLTAFAPAAGWRLIYGHFNIILGALVFVAAFALMAAAQNESLSFTLVVVSFIALTHSFQTFGHQLVLYGALFGAPLLLPLAWPGQRPGQPSGEPGARGLLRRLALPVLLTAAAFIWSLPVFYGMLSHALSSDAGRAIGGPPVTYAEIVAAPEDWLGSLPWTGQLVKSSRDPSRVHETNYPFGPLLLLLWLLPWSWAGWGAAGLLGYGFLLSAAAALLFSMNVEPFSGWMLKSVPLLQSFRVPARAVLPALLVLPSLGAAALLARMKGTWRAAALLWLLPAAAAVFLIPPGLREAAAWLLAGAAVCGRLLWPEKTKSWSPELFLLLLAVASAAAFKERLFGFWAEKTLVEQPAAQGAEILRQAPELASSLTRTLISSEPSPFQMNRGYLLGVSTLDGHWAPQRRFLELYFALLGETPNLSVTSFHFHAGDRAYPVLRPLYNVRFNAKLGGPAPQVAALPPAGGEAWFSRGLEGVPDFAALAARLEQRSGELPAFLPKTLLTVSSDPWVKKAALPAALDGACAQARVLSVEAPHGSQAVRLRTETAARCPLTLAENFAEILHARGKTLSGEWAELALFPAYGALAGVMVEPGVSELVVEPQPAYFAPPWLDKLLGLLLLSGAFFFTARVRRTEPAPAAKEKKNKKNRQAA